MGTDKKLTPTEKAFLEKIAQLPAEGKKIAMASAAGVVAVYAAQAAKTQQPA